MGKSRWVPVFSVAFALLLSVSASASMFSTFVSGGDIASAVGGNSTIAFNYAGNKFVGSVYFNNQLFSTNLNGGSVQKFGAPLPDASAAVGEVVVGASLGQAGFAKGDIFAGSGANTNIYHFNNAGTTQSLFTTLPTGGDIRQIFFDPGSSFGGNMIVTTASGDIYSVTSSGVASLIASTHEDTEGVDVAPASWGIYAGNLIVASEGTGSLRLVSPGGTVVTIPGITIGLAETVSAVPDNLGSGNPLEGFYVANYPVDIQKADASNFLPYKGDVIVTSEFSSNSTIWDLKFDGTNFTATAIDALPNQSEDGIFVTAERIVLVTPEPSSILMLAGGLLGLGAKLRWRKK